MREVARITGTWGRVVTSAVIWNWTPVPHSDCIILLVWVHFLFLYSIKKKSRLWVTKFHGANSHLVTAFCITEWKKLPIKYWVCYVSSNTAILYSLKHPLLALIFLFWSSVQNPDPWFLCAGFNEQCIGYEWYIGYKQCLFFNLVLSMLHYIV